MRNILNFLTIPALVFSAQATHAQEAAAREAAAKAQEAEAGAQQAWSEYVAASKSILKTIQAMRAQNRGSKAETEAALFRQAERDAWGRMAVDKAAGAGAAEAFSGYDAAANAAAEAMVAALSLDYSRILFSLLEGGLANQKELEAKAKAANAPGLAQAESNAWNRVVEDAGAATAKEIAAAKLAEDIAGVRWVLATIRTGVWSTDDSAVPVLENARASVTKVADAESSTTRLAELKAAREALSKSIAALAADADKSIANRRRDLEKNRNDLQASSYAVAVKSINSVLVRNVTLVVAATAALDRARDRWIPAMEAE
jgi:hypothetical protein